MLIFNLSNSMPETDLTEDFKEYVQSHVRKHTERI